MRSSKPATKAGASGTGRNANPKPRRSATDALYQDYAAPGLLGIKGGKIGCRQGVSFECRLTPEPSCSDPESGWSGSGHNPSTPCAGYGVIGPKSKAGLKKLIATLDDDTNGLPGLVLDAARMYVEHIDTLTTRISDLTNQFKALAKSSGKVRRLTTMPGVGLQTALAIEAFAPDMGCFKRGRDFAAWLGPVPLQHSTGGKDRVGKVSKMGRKDIRRLLITGRCR